MIKKRPIFMLFGCSLLLMTSGLVMLDSSQGDEGWDLKHFIGDTSFKVLLPLPSTLQRSGVWKTLGKRLPAILPAWPPAENTIAGVRQGEFYSSHVAPFASVLEGASVCAVTLQSGLFLPWAFQWGSVYLYKKNSPPSSLLPNIKQ